MLLEARVVDRDGAERLEREPHDERDPGYPEDPCRAEPARAEARPRDDRRDDHEQRREVGGADLDRRRLPVESDSDGW